MNGGHNLLNELDTAYESLARQAIQSVFLKEYIFEQKKPKNPRKIMVLLFYHLQRFFGVELNRDDDPKILHAAMDR